MQGTNKPVKAINKPVKAINKPVKAMNKPVKAINKPVKAMNKPVTPRFVSLVRNMWQLLVPRMLPALSLPSPPACTQG